MHRWILASIVLLVSGFLVSCTNDSTDGESGPDLSKLVPVKGTVKLNGKPLTTAVVTFLPQQWVSSLGETDEDGKFTLETAGQPGALPGEYKVAISYLVAESGEPLGLAPRSAISPPPEVASAKEMLPKNYSDFDRTSLVATVAANGGEFNFEITADLNPEQAQPAGTTEEATSKQEPEAPESPANESKPQAN